MTTNLSLYCGPPGPSTRPVSEILNGNLRETKREGMSLKKLVKIMSLVLQFYVRW